MAHDCTWYVIVFSHALDGDFIPGSASPKSYSVKTPFYVVRVALVWVNSYITLHKNIEFRERLLFMSFLAVD
jgi:hypothetical protein